MPLFPTPIQKLQFKKRSHIRAFALQNYKQRNIRSIVLHILAIRVKIDCSRVPAGGESIGRQVVSDPHTFRERVPWDVEQVGRIHRLGHRRRCRHRSRSWSRPRQRRWWRRRKRRLRIRRDNSYHLRGGDKSFDVWSIVRERNGWTMTLNCGIDQLSGQNVFFFFFLFTVLFFFSFFFSIKTYFLFYFIYLL